MIDVGLLSKTIDGCGESTKVIVKIIAEDNVLAWRRVEQLREENERLRKALEKICGTRQKAGFSLWDAWSNALFIAEQALEGNKGVIA